MMHAKLCQVRINWLKVLLSGTEWNMGLYKHIYHFHIYSDKEGYMPPKLSHENSFQFSLSLFCGSISSTFLLIDGVYPISLSCISKHIIFSYGVTQMKESCHLRQIRVEARHPALLKEFSCRALNFIKLHTKICSCNIDVIMLARKILLFDKSFTASNNETLRDSPVWLLGHSVTYISVAS